MRWKAPEHTHSVDLASGPVVVKHGHATIPDDISDGERASLIAMGFTPDPETKAEAKASAAVKAD